jgi:hypothetical protein
MSRKAAFADLSMEKHQSGRSETRHGKVKILLYTAHCVRSPAYRWILESGTPLLRLFLELPQLEFYDSLEPEVEMLLDLKMTSPEIRRVSRSDKISSYLDASISEIKERTSLIPEELSKDWNQPNDLFLSARAEVIPQCG